MRYSLVQKFRNMACILCKSRVVKYASAPMTCIPPTSIAAYDLVSQATLAAPFQALGFASMAWMGGQVISTAWRFGHEAVDRMQGLRDLATGKEDIEKINRQLRYFTCAAGVFGALITPPVLPTAIQRASHYLSDPSRPLADIDYARHKIAETAVQTLNLASGPTH